LDDHCGCLYGLVASCGSGFCGGFMKTLKNSVNVAAHKGVDVYLVFIPIPTV